MMFESVEVRCPKLPVRGQPVVELREWLGPDAIEAALRIRACFHEARVLEDAKVLGHSRLAEAEAVDELPDRLFAVAQEVEDLKPPRLGQDLQGSESSHDVEYCYTDICLSRH
jgi:hypothetical protein